MDWRPYKTGVVRIIRNNKTDGTIDPVRGCTGCELSVDCYARRMATIGRTFFSQPVPQVFSLEKLVRQVLFYGRTHSWIRVGCTGDPSLDWELTARVVRTIAANGVRPVVVTKVHTAPALAFLREITRHAQVQVSVSGLQSVDQRVRRLATAELVQALDGQAVLRLVSAAFTNGSRADREQTHLLTWARRVNMPVLETPLRVHSTSPTVEFLDWARYHRHRSPISGWVDHQYTAGLLFDADAYPCFSTCSPTARGDFDPGCPHQCVTVGK